MKSASMISAVVFIVLLIFTGCSDAGNDPGDVALDGSLTIAYEGAYAGNMTDLSDNEVFAYTYESGSSGGNPLAGNYKTIDTSSYEAVFLEKEYSNNDNNWFGSGNATYDVYIFVEYGDTYGQYDDGIDYAYKDYPITYTQDGDKTIIVDSLDFSN